MHKIIIQYSLKIIFVTTLLTILSSCGGGGGGGVTPPSTIATLSGLTISAGAISPAFTSGTTGYTLATTATSTTVTPTLSQANATITINGTAVAPGAISADIALAVGETVITVIVTAQDSATTQTYTLTLSRITSLELLDPAPGANHAFGTTTVVLANGNVVVSERRDSSRFTDNGAVHLYSPLSSTPITSLYGDAANDQLGSGGITVLANNNYVISSGNDDENGIVNAGSVRLMNGSTGEQIGNALVGDVENDFLGLSGIVVLANNNYVIPAEFDDENGIINAGAVRLVNGNTGEQIGSTLVGDVEGDSLGDDGIEALANNNFVIASRLDDENGIVNAGSVRLMNGSTGDQIGTTLTGDEAGDLFGSNGITALANNNYVITSEFDDVNGIVNAGSVRLVDGSTGMQIGSTLAGDEISDQLGWDGITTLANNNYVIASRFDDENGISDAGSVRLMNGSTGGQIGSTLAGDGVSDQLGSSSITALGNNNYVIASYRDDVNGIVDAGSVRLMNGSNGMQVGSTLAGDEEGDQLGLDSIQTLANNNYVVASGYDNENGIVEAGSVRLMDGTTGVQIGSTLAGDVEEDHLGEDGIAALANNNYVIVTQYDNENGIVKAGSVRLVDGSTGDQIGSTLAGDVENDRLGSRVTGLANNNYVVLSRYDDENGIVDAGSVRLVNGNTGGQIGNTLSGSAGGDMIFARITKSNSGDYYILSQPGADKGGQVNAGMVRIVVP